MNKVLKECIEAIDYADNTLLVQSGGSSGVSLALFVTAIGVPDDTARTSFSLVFSCQ